MGKRADKPKKVKIVTPSEAGSVLGKLSYPARVKKFGEEAVLNTSCKNLELARAKRWAN